MTTPEWPAVSEEELCRMLRGLRVDPPSGPFVESLQQRLIEQARFGALRVDPPDNGFDDRLRERLESASQRVRIRPLRSAASRRRALWAVAASVTFAGAAAASVDGEFVGRLVRQVVAVVSPASDTPPLADERLENRERNTPRARASSEDSSASSANELPSAGSAPALSVPVPRVVADGAPGVERSSVALLERRGSSERRASLAPPSEAFGSREQMAEARRMVSVSRAAVSDSTSRSNRDVELLRPSVPRVHIGIEENRRALEAGSSRPERRLGVDHVREVARERRAERVRERIDGERSSRVAPNFERSRAEQRRERRAREPLRDGRSPR